MDILVRDTRLNVSQAYLRPGFPYGGSCLPKDVSALTRMCRSHAAHLPVMEALATSRSAQISGLAARIFDLAEPDRPIGIIGLSFKPGTDDCRESAPVALIEALLDAGAESLKLHMTRWWETVSHPDHG